MRSFKTYCINEVVARHPQQGQEDVYHPDDQEGDYITILNQMTPVVGGRFIYKAFQFVPGQGADATHGFRTLKNAGRGYMVAHPNQYNLDRLADYHDFDMESGGGTLAPQDYNDLVDQGMQMFRNKYNSLKRDPDTKVGRFTHIVTPASQSPHAMDLGDRIRRILGTLQGTETSSELIPFLPSMLKKSTKAELFLRLFNPRDVTLDDINQELINQELHRYHTRPAYKEHIDRRFMLLLHTDNPKIKEDPSKLIKNFMAYLGGPKAVNTQVSMADDIRIRVGKAHDRNIIGYFDNSPELIEAMQTPGSKHVLVVDDNISTGSTVTAGEDFFKRMAAHANQWTRGPVRHKSERTSISVSWFFLLYRP